MPKHTKANDVHAETSSPRLSSLRSNITNITQSNISKILRGIAIVVAAIFVIGGIILSSEVKSLEMFIIGVVAALIFAMSFFAMAKIIDYLNEIVENLRAGFCFGYTETITHKKRDDD